ncbi:MAG: hypothetical protein RIC55_23380 [Pirellulaceae bacterium]
MAWFSRKIEVTLIDDSTGETIGVMKASPDDLPASFDRETTLHLGDADWLVVDASCTTRAAYTRRGKLMLRLRRIESIPFKDILYTTPTLFDPLPQFDASPLDGDEFVLASDDDWRQVEFVSHQLGQVVLEEIAQILRIHETASEGIGWRELHIRRRPEAPLVCDLSIDELLRALQVAKPEGVTYWGAKGRIRDGYSLTTHDGLKLYGLAPRGRVEVIALGCGVDEHEDGQSVGRLATLAGDLQLDLVDWPRCGRVLPGDPWFDAILRNEEPPEEGRS